jgi:hypothetical protein
MQRAPENSKTVPRRCTAQNAAFRFFRAETSAFSDERLKLENGLRLALTTKHTRSIETLSRWRGSAMSPHAFIALAKEWASSSRSANGRFAKPADARKWQGIACCRARGRESVRAPISSARTCRCHGARIARHRRGHEVPRDRAHQKAASCTTRTSQRAFLMPEP